jgi:LysR family hydrogen peroxide-inducible transcriptional activator
MELHQLRYFVTVAQTGNFSRAAERCFVSQPSLSQQIQKLERQLGQPLFNRLGRRAVLTDAGRLLLDRAMSVLATVDDAERRLLGGGTNVAGSDAAQQTGRLAIGAIPTVAPYLLPRALRAFIKRCPRVELLVREDVTRELVSAVVQGDLEMALIAAASPPDEHLESEVLFWEHLLLALPPGHALAKRRQRVGVADLAAERFILLGEMHCLGEQVLSFCRAHECQPRIACRSAQIATIQSLIALGQGISLLPDMARAADRSRKLVYRQLCDPQPRRTIAVIRHKHSYRGALAEMFLGVLRGLGATAQ